MGDAITLDDGRTLSRSSIGISGALDLVARHLPEEHEQLRDWLVDVSERPNGCASIDLRGLPEPERRAFHSGVRTAYDRTIGSGMIIGPHSWALSCIDALQAMSESIERGEPPGSLTDTPPCDEESIYVEDLTQLWRPILFRGKIKIDQRDYRWQVREGSCFRFPAAAQVLSVHSEDGESEFLMAVQEDPNAPDSESTWSGPVFAASVDPQTFPSLEAGSLYLFAPFHTPNAVGSYTGVVRAVIERLRSGDGILQVDAPAASPIPAETSATPSSPGRWGLVAFSVGLLAVVAVGVAAGMSAGWYLDGENVSAFELVCLITGMTSLLWSILMLLTSKVGKV